MSEQTPNDSGPPPPDKGRFGGNTFLDAADWAFGRAEQPASSELGNARMPPPVRPPEAPPGGGNGPEGPNGPEDKSNEWWPFNKEEWERSKPSHRPTMAIKYYEYLPAADYAKNESRVRIAFQKLESYALRGGLQGTRAEISDMKDELQDYDAGILQEYVQKANPLSVGVLRAHLDRLDGFYTELKSFRELNVGEEGWEKGLNFSPENVEKAVKDRRSIEAWIASLEAQIGRAVNSQFINERRERVNGMIEREWQLKQLEQLEKLRNIEEDAEERIFFRIEEDEEPSIEEEVNENLPSFQETQQFIQSQRVLPEDQRDRESLEKAQKRLEWYFYQARELGITTEVEYHLNNLYLRYRNRLQPERVLPRVTTALHKEIKDYREYASSPEYWEVTEEAVRENLAQFQLSITKFRGIVPAYIDSVDRQTSYQQRKSLNPSIPDLPRLPGQFNIRNLELAVEMQAEQTRRAIERREENQQFYEYVWGRFILRGNNEEQIDKGIDQIVDNILYGSGASDVSAIYQKMAILGEAIEEASRKLAPEFKSSMERDVYRERWINKSRAAVNRIIFPLEQYTLNNIDVKSSTGLGERWAQRELKADGYEKLREILRDPDIYFIMKKLYAEYKLYNRPAGRKGQLAKVMPAQYVLRSQLKDLLANETIDVEFSKEADPAVLLGRLPDLELQRLFGQRKSSIFTENEDGSRVEFSLRDAVEEARKRFNQASTLEEKRKARDLLRKAKIELYERETVVKGKVDFAIAVLDSLGESAYIGQSSIVMKNGDHIRRDDTVHIGKFSILREAQKIGDTPALMRWRARIWNAAWMEAGLNRVVAKEIYKKKVSEEYQKIGQDVPKFMLDLKSGFEELGFTTDEFDVHNNAFNTLDNQGENADFGEVEERDDDGTIRKTTATFEYILQIDQIKDVRNNFISIYASARDIFSNPTAIREAKKGNDPYLLKILRRLDTVGRGKFSDLDRAFELGRLQNMTPEQLKEMFEDAIADSFWLQITTTQLTRYRATRGEDNKFTSDKLDFEHPGRPWALAILEDLFERWATNKRQYIGRGIELSPWMPYSLSGLSQESSCETLFELVQNINKQYLDTYFLIEYFERINNSQDWRTFGETQIDEQGGIRYGMWDKILNDANSLREQFQDRIIREIEKYPSNIGMRDQEKLVGATLDVMKREQPTDNATEKQLSLNRVAGGSGLGRELNDRWNLKVWEWILSEAIGDRQTQGGGKSYETVYTIFNFLRRVKAYAGEHSYMEEVIGKYTGSRRVALPSAPPRVKF